MLGDETNKIVEQRPPLPFRQFMLLGQAGREMLESDWSIGRFRLSCHSLEPFIECERAERLRKDMIRGRMKSWLRPKAMMAEGDGGNPLTYSYRHKASYPQARNCFKVQKMFNFPALPVT
jgi:hypothetical protein